MRCVRLCAAATTFVVALADGVSAQATTGLDEAQQQELVAAHNRWRREVGVPALRWADDLAQEAQAWAVHLRDARYCRLEHSKGTKLGENLFWASALRWSDGRAELQRIAPGKVVDSWAGEKRFYDGKFHRCQAGKACGHYTQLVWRDSTEVGCAMAVCTDASQLWVCNYRPPGNYVGKRPY
mgnify:CR=1 FL=1